MKQKLNALAAALPRLLTLDRAAEDIKVNQGRILTELNRTKTSADLADYEFKIFSQWGEDGIIQHLTQSLDLPNRTFIEFGIEDFSESNCRFLMIKDNWRGFVIDGSPANIERLRGSSMYLRHGIEARAAFITRENIAALLADSGFAPEPGILSVDIDGNDWHVLAALEDWRPAIAIVEYNAVFGLAPVSVPYDPAFVRREKHFSNLYWGASLGAFDHLLAGRGYALVGCNSAGSNAFFVRRDLLNDRVRAVSLADGFRDVSWRDSRDAAGRLNFLSGEARIAAIADMPLVDVASGATLTVGALPRG